MIEELLPIFDKAYRFKVDYKLNTQLHNIAIKQLGLNNMNQLRDRYEGQAYLDRFLIRSFSEFAVQKMLGTDFVSIDLKVNKYYKPSLLYKGDKYEIVGSSMDDYPLIPTVSFDYAILSFVNIGRKEVYIIGSSTQKDIIKLIDSTPLSPIKSNAYLGYLKNFSKVKPFDLLPIENE